mgnify:CR=1 FL=1
MVSAAPRRGVVAALLARLGGGRWRSAVRRAAQPRVRVRHGRADGTPYTAITLVVPAADYPGVARALAESAACLCTARRGTVGLVTVVPGEEPILVALAPQRDAVANRVLRVLLAGESHRAPHLLLLLRHGVYLAQVIDPYAPLVGTFEEIAAMLDKRRAGLAVRLNVRPQRRAVEVELLLAAPDAHALRAALAAARAPFAPSSGRAAPAVPLPRRARR